MRSDDGQVPNLHDRLARAAVEAVFHANPLYVALHRLYGEPERVVIDVDAGEPARRISDGE